jgi:hypothetical protein
MFTDFFDHHVLLADGHPFAGLFVESAGFGHRFECEMMTEVTGMVRLVPQQVLGIDEHISDTSRVFGSCLSV